MTDLRTAAQQALEALVIGSDAAHEVAQNYHEAMAGYRPARHIAVDDDVRKIEAAITALRAALAEPVQEPVYWEVRCTAHPKWMRVDEQQFDEYVANGWGGQRLYTAPPQRKPLSEKEIAELTKSYPASSMWRLIVSTARAIERAHGIT